MNTQYVKYNKETKTIEAGPQEHKPDDTWVTFVPASESTFDKETALWFDETRQALTQWVIGDKEQPYNLQRKVSYPQIPEQFDKLFHDITNGTLTTDGEWYQSIKAVKDAIPKPEETDGD